MDGNSKIVLTFNVRHNDDTLIFDGQEYVKDFNDPNIFIAVNLITTIGNRAFQDCPSLTRIDIPNSVTTIGDYAFFNCTSLTDIIIPNSVTTIGDCTFYNCIALNQVVIPNSVINIGNGAFAYCTALTYIVISSSVESIGNAIFAGCYALTNLETNDEHSNIVQYCRAKYPDIQIFIDTSYMMK